MLMRMGFVESTVPPTDGKEDLELIIDVPKLPKNGEVIGPWRVVSGLSSDYILGHSWQPCEARRVQTHRNRTSFEIADKNGRIIMYWIEPYKEQTNG